MGFLLSTKGTWRFRSSGNTSLLRKWIYKLMNEEGVWQELLQNKYLKTKTLS
jgi:hypothetical protein